MKTTTMTINIKQHLDLLGHKVRDRVTALEGVVASVTFDLYGCVQAVINPGMDKDGKLRDQHYIDVGRLEVLSAQPVMSPPEFLLPGPVAAGERGPAERPAITKA